MVLGEISKTDARILKGTMTVAGGTTGAAGGLIIGSEHIPSSLHFNAGPLYFDNLSIGTYTGIGVGAVLGYYLTKFAIERHNRNVQRQGGTRRFPPRS